MTRRRAPRVLFVCVVCIGLGQSMLFAILPPVPFLAVCAALQAVRATTVITSALFLQDTFTLSATQAPQHRRGFVTLAAAGHQ